MPAIYLPHGGGPWPFVDLGSFVQAHEVQSLSEYLKGLVAWLPRRPRAMVVVSAHWEAKVPTVMTLREIRRPEPSHERNLRSMEDGPGCQ